MTTKFDSLQAGNGQSLITHSLAVANVVRYLARDLLKLDVDKYTDLILAAYVAGLYHDVGKALPRAQMQLNDAECEEPLYVNELGWRALLEGLTSAAVDAAVKTSDVRVASYQIDGLERTVADGVMWSNVSSGAEQVLTTTQKDRDQINDFAQELLNRAFGSELRKQAKKRLVEEPNLPRYSPGGREMIVRALISAADRLVSMLDIDTVNDLAYNGPAALLRCVDLQEITHASLKQKVELPTPEHADERTAFQHKVANDDSHIALLVVACGGGKTRAAVQRAIRRNRRTIWVCPRNIVAEAMYYGIQVELRALGLDALYSVELYLTGERKRATGNAPDAEYTADFVVTNIDNLLKPMLGGSYADKALRTLLSDVVMDEYHEYTGSNPALMYAFVAFMRARAMCRHSSTLLLSATPMDLSHLWDPTPGYTKRLPEFGYGPSAHNKSFRIRTFDGRTHRMQAHWPGLIMANSTRLAQDLYSATPGQRQTSMLVHSKFERSVRSEHVLDILNRLGKDHAGATGDWRLVAAPGVQSALDFSVQHAQIASSSPETDMQAARVNRFGEYDTGCIDYYNTRNDPTYGASESAAVGVRASRKIANLWWDHLVSVVGDERVMTYLEYQSELYLSFYDAHGDAVLEYLRERLDEGREELDALAPRRTHDRKRKNKKPRQGAKTIRNPKGSFYMTVQRLDGSWAELDYPWSVTYHEMASMHKEHGGLDARQWERLFRRMGYKRLLAKVTDTAPQYAEEALKYVNSLVWARNPSTPYPVQPSVAILDPELGIRQRRYEGYDYTYERVSPDVPGH